MDHFNSGCVLTSAILIGTNHKTLMKEVLLGGQLMDIEKQKSAPVYEALESFRKQRVVPFDVPGHKRGRGNPELVKLLGEKCVGLDVNSMKPLDNLCHPVSVIYGGGAAGGGSFRRGARLFSWWAGRPRRCRAWCSLPARQGIRSSCPEMSTGALSMPSSSAGPSPSMSTPTSIRISA